MSDPRQLTQADVAAMGAAFEELWHGSLHGDQEQPQRGWAESIFRSAWRTARSSSPAPDLLQAEAAQLLTRCLRYVQPGDSLSESLRGSITRWLEAQNAAVASSPVPAEGDDPDETPCERCGHASYFHARVGNERCTLECFCEGFTPPAPVSVGDEPTKEDKDA